MNLITTQSIQSTALDLGMNFKINPDLIREMTVLFMTSKPFVWVTTTYIIEVAMYFICRWIPHSAKDMSTECKCTWSVRNTGRYCSTLICNTTCLCIGRDRRLWKPSLFQGVISLILHNTFFFICHLIQRRTVIIKFILLRLQTLYWILMHYTGGKYSI